LSLAIWAFVLGGVQYYKILCFLPKETNINPNK